MNIIYQDTDIIVANKPAGISSQHTDTNNGLPDILSKELNTEIFTVHRLDIQTNGLIVYAKNKTAAAVLSKEITDDVFTKEYIARVHGEPTEKSGTFTDLLFKDSKKNKSYVVKRERKGVKKAVLNYETLAVEDTPLGRISTVKIKLVTGRTHQIRVQFASRRMPLVGDGKYGAADNAPALALTSARLAFIHPKTGKTLEFSLE